MDNLIPVDIKHNISPDPFGMITMGRSWDVGSGYRYGFNGKEGDDEIHGKNNAIDYGNRVYDTRLGKFLSIDPLTKKYPMLTPYQYASNRPIDGTDMDGLEYIKASEITRNDLPLIGLTFESEVEREVWIQEHLITYQGETYVDLGFHVYRDANGSLSNVNGEGSTKVSEWVYTEIQVFDNTDHIYSWNDPTVSGSKTFGNKIVPNNRNCAELAKRQVAESGATAKVPLANSDNNILIYDGNTNSTITLNYDKAIDYIHTELEAGRAVMVGADVHSGSSNGNGTDHYVTISGRNSDSEGGYFTFYEDATGDKDGVSDIARNKLRPGNNAISGDSPNWDNNHLRVTTVQINSNGE